MPSSPGEYNGTVIKPGTDAEVAAQVADIDKQKGTTSGSTTGATDSTTSGVIGVDEMKNSGNAKKPTFVTPAPLTASTGVLGLIGANADNFTKTLAEEAKTAETGRTQAFQSLMQELGQVTGKTSQENELYSKKGGVDDTKSALKEINGQLTAEQVALRHQLEKVDKNETGMLAPALAAYKQKLTDESLSRQADLAVKQMAAQGQFDSAKEIADRAVAASTEQQQQKIDLLKYYYEENKDLFTVAEQRVFETAQGDRQAKLQEESSKRMALFQQSIDKEMVRYRAQYGGDGGGTNTFTQTQLNTGAANAGMPIADFKNLSTDDKNYFINGYSNFEDAVKKYQDGDITAADLDSGISDSGLSDSAQQVLYKKAGITKGQTDEDTGTDWGAKWDSVKSWIGL